MNITAKTHLTIEADGHQVNNVQPGSEQLYLLGANVTLRNLMENHSNQTPKSAPAIIETIPARKGCFIEASLEQDFAAGEEVVFVNTLQSHGFSSMDSILTFSANGNLLILFWNFRQSSTNPEAGKELGAVERFDGQVKSPDSKQHKLQQSSTSTKYTNYR